MERRRYVELGRRVRYLCHLSRSSDGRLSSVPGGKQAGGLCCGVGRMQPLFPQLLHVSVGEAEQPLSPVPAGLGGSENRQIRPVRRTVCKCQLHLRTPQHGVQPGCDPCSAAPHFMDSWTSPHDCMYSSTGRRCR